MKSILITLLALVVSFGSCASAADISKVKLGDHVIGPKLTKTKMRKKVVILEDWGVKCGPCRKMVAKLAELDKKYRDQGLVIIGNECQGSSKEKIEALFEKHGAEYTVTQKTRSPFTTNMSIPYAVVFNAKGDVIFKGKPNKKSGFMEAVETALAEDGIKK